MTMGIAVAMFIWALYYLPPAAYHMGLCGNLLHKNEIEECVEEPKRAVSAHAQGDEGMAVMVSNATAMTSSYIVYGH